MKRLMTVIAVVAASFIGWADTTNSWFDAEIESYTEWPVTGLEDGEWSTEDAAGLAGVAALGDGTLAVDTTNSLVWAANAGVTLADAVGEISYSASMVMEPENAAPTEVPENSKGAIMIVRTAEGFAFYGLVKDGDNDANKWQALDYDGTIDINAEQAITVKYAKASEGYTITYIANDKELTVGSVAAQPIYLASAAFAGARFTGCGEVSTLTAEQVYVDQTLTYSVAALAANHISVTIEGYTPSTVGDVMTFTLPYGKAFDAVYTADTGYLFADKTSTKTVSYENGITAPTTPDISTIVSKQCDFKNGSTYYLTLFDALENAADGTTVEVLRDATGSGWYAPAGRGQTLGITLDFGGHTYTLNDGGKRTVKNYSYDYAFALEAGMNMTLQNGTLKCVPPAEQPQEGGSTNHVTSYIKSFVRSFGKSLTLNNMTFDGTNLWPYEDTNSVPVVANSDQAIRVVSGDLNLTGNTEVINLANKNAITAAEHTGNVVYSLGTINIAVNDGYVIDGTIGIYGGKLTFENTNWKTANTRFFFGVSKGSIYTDACVAGCGFKARVGTLPTENTASGSKLMGELFLDLNAAFTQASAKNLGYARTLALMDDATLTSRIDIANNAEATAEDKVLTVDLNGKTITPTAACGNGSAFNVTAGEVTITNGTIDASAVVDTDVASGECDPITVRNGATVNLTAGLKILINTKNGACAYAFDGGRVNIYGGEYDNQTLEDYQWAPGIKGMPLNQANVATQLIYVYGGKFRQYNPANGDDAGLCTTFLANGYYSTKQGDWWVIGDQEPEAEIGGVFYLTMADALNAVKDGETIKFNKSLTLASRIDVAASGKSITIDLNGKTITPTAACGNGSAFNVTAGEVTITNGTIDASAVVDTDVASGECDPITVRSGATVNLTAGLKILINTKNGACAYAFDGGRVNIYGGEYDNQTLEEYEWKKGITGMPLNQANVATQLIYVYGGKFRQYNPANGDDAGLCTTFIAKGYYSVKNGDFYDVTNTGVAAAIGDNGYTTLDAALAAAEDGVTVKLCSNIETSVAQQWTITKDITLDFDCYTITKNISNDWVFRIAKDANVIFWSSAGPTAGGITFNPIANGNLNNPASMIQIFGTLTINSGRYESDFTIFKVDEDDGYGSAGTLVVNSGWFEINKKPDGYTGYQWAVMNWATATINGGTWNAYSVIGTRSADNNKVSKAGTTEIPDATKLLGAPKYFLFVGDGTATSTCENLPKIKGVAIDKVTFGKSAAITADLELTTDGEYVTLKEKTGTVFTLTAVKYDNLKYVIGDVTNDFESAGEGVYTAQMDFDTTFTVLYTMQEMVGSKMPVAAWSNLVEVTATLVADTFTTPSSSATCSAELCVVDAAESDDVEEEQVAEAIIAKDSSLTDEQKAAVESNVATLTEKAGSAKGAAAWLESKGFGSGTATSISAADVAAAKSIDVSYDFDTEKLFTTTPAAEVTEIVVAEADDPTANVAYELTFEFKDGDTVVNAAAATVAKVQAIVKGTTDLNDWSSAEKVVTPTVTTAAPSAGKITAKVELPNDKAQAFMKFAK